MIINADKVEDSFVYNTLKRKSSSNSSNAGAIAAGLLLANELNNKNKKKDDKLEKEMDIYSLADWQKKEVRKGNYDSWNFEEENLEEDDYFFYDSD